MVIADTNRITNLDIVKRVYIMSRDISESSILTKSSEGNTTFTTRIALVIVPCVVICPGHALRIILLQSHNCVVRPPPR